MEKKITKNAKFVKRKVKQEKNMEKKREFGRVEVEVELLKFRV